MPCNDDFVKVTNPLKINVIPQNLKGGKIEEAMAFSRWVLIVITKI